MMMRRCALCREPAMLAMSSTPDRVVVTVGCHYDRRCNNRVERNYQIEGDIAEMQAAIVMAVTAWNQQQVTVKK